MFQDLILIYWTGEGVYTSSPGWVDFMRALKGSRYDGHTSVIGSLDSIQLEVKSWCNQSKFPQDTPWTVYFGFQGEPGWTLPEFHDILRVTTKLPILVPGVVVSWLPDNWFMHPGLTPNLTSGEDALDWLEQQVQNDPLEEILYNYKGEHHDARP